MTEQEHQSSTHAHNWDNAPSSSGKGKHPPAQHQQHAQQQHQRSQQQPSWGNTWQQPGKGKGSWDPFAGNADWTNYSSQPAQTQQAQQDIAPSPPTSLQPSMQIPASELKWAGDRPYHQNPRTGEWLCALACTNTVCKFGRPACNFKPRGRILDDRHSPHSCSHCLAKGAGK